MLFENAITDSFITDTDSYKLSHYAQYPEGAEIVSSYVEVRKDWAGMDAVIFFGLQVELDKMRGEVVTQDMIDAAAPFLKAHGFDIFVAGWQRIVDVHGGRLPIEIHALPEGVAAPVGVPQLRIENTDPALYWLPSYLETRLLRAIWYPGTVATLSHAIVEGIRERLTATDGSDAGAEFKLHDFGARGASCSESAALAGAAHLVNAMGTDTIAGTVLARNVYGAEMAGYSIPASEHSTMTALGEEGELMQMERFLDAYPTGLVSCVSDSYDLFRAIRDYWGDALRDRVLARDGTLVIRPDSGDPLEIVPDVIEALMERFGEEETETGYRILPPQVRVIQGDGIGRRSIIAIMDAMMARRLAIGNIAFGMGGALHQKVTRDSFGYAMKASAIRIDGVWRDVWKDPATGGGKTSKRGRQAAETRDGKLVAVRLDDLVGEDALRPVFRDGEILRIHRFEEIRGRAWPGVAGFDPEA